MPVYFDKSKGRWRFTFNRVIAGQRARFTKLLPKGWSRSRSERWGEKETSRLYAVATGLERQPATVGQAVSLYLERRCPHLKNGRKVAQNLALLLPYIEGRPLTALPEISRAYIDDNPELSAGTLHNRLAYLKAACRYAWKKHGLTDHDPTGRMEIPRPNNNRDVQLPVDRIQRLLGRLRAVDVEACALFTLAFRTATRWRKGIWPRKPEDVDRQGRDVWLRIGITKNGTPRMKWVHPDARWALEYLPFPRSQETYWDRFVQARELEGLGWLWAHDMRHVVGTDIRKRGGSLEDVGAALDHISHASSARYAHITPVQVKRVLSGVGTKMHTYRRGKRAKRAA